MSAGTVSNVASALDADLQVYPSKPLSDDIVFLFLDGASQKVREIYPLRRIQRCIADKLWNVVGKRKRAQRVPCMAEAKRIFGAPSRGEAIRRFKGWREKWFEEAESAVRRLEKDLFHCLHPYRFLEELWRTIRTTHILERAFREVRKRTRAMDVFTHAESAERITYGVAKNLNTHWEEHPLRDIQQNH